MAALTDRNGRVTRYEYDVHGRRTLEEWLGDVPPGGGARPVLRTIGFGYDEAGRLETVTDSDGPDFTYHYDGVGRLDEKTVAGLTPEAIKLAQQFNEAHQRTKLEVSFVGETDVELRKDYGYDAAGRLETLTQWRPALVGLGDSTVYADRVTFGYDGASRLSSIERQTAEGVAPSAGGWSTAVRSSYAYDAEGRLANLTHARGESVIESYGWKYDSLNRLSEFRSVVDGVTSYGYDERGQLETVDRPGTAEDESYTYDANGNRITADSAAAGDADYVTGVNNRLLSDGTYTYEYDDEGNRTARVNIASGVRDEYAWDHRNRLTGVVMKDGAGAVVMRTEYDYDAFHHRVARRIFVTDGLGVETLSLERRYVYDGDVLLLEFNSLGGIEIAYFTSGGSVLAQHRTGNDVEWLLADRLGSTRFVVDGDGVILDRYTYDAYGNLTSDHTDTLVTNILFTGLYYDPETRLSYAWHRYYEGATGRWLSEDPIGFGGGTSNLGEYVGNGPTNGVDPTGLAEISPEAVLNELRTTNGISNSTFWAARAMRMGEDNDRTYTYDIPVPGINGGRDRVAQIDHEIEFGNFGIKKRDEFKVYWKDAGKKDAAPKEMTQDEKDALRKKIAKETQLATVVGLTAPVAVAATCVAAVTSGAAAATWFVVRTAACRVSTWVGSVATGASERVNKWWNSLTGFFRGPTAASAPRALDPFVGTGNPAGFGRLIGWGTGAQGAVARTASITLQELQTAGITRPVAEHWLNFYRNAVANGQGGATAPERIKLMQRVIELLGE